ncbi:DUF3417 domain-containing protein, partial [Arthrobacter sp. GN70]|nr:DUF3417 domain-containing protein [Arthrobacter sp. GN70]
MCLQLRDMCPTKGVTDHYLQAVTPGASHMETMAVSHLRKRVSLPNLSLFRIRPTRSPVPARTVSAVEHLRPLIRLQGSQSATAAPQVPSKQQPPGGPPMKAIRKITVRTVLPEAISPLAQLAKNLRWSWHLPTRELFAS